MLTRLSRFIVAWPKRILVVAVLLAIAGGIGGSTVMSSLSAGGFYDPSSESVQAAKLMQNTFKRGGLQVVLRLTVPGDISKNAEAKTQATEILAKMQTIDYVQQPIVSYWTTPGAESGLISNDKHSALIVGTLAGDDKAAAKNGGKFKELFAGTRNGVEITAGGQAVLFKEINDQTGEDLFTAEAIAIPISFVALIFIFGGLVAASIPLVIGGFGIVMTAALLNFFTLFTNVSVFALNLSTAMGLALAIDYTLLIINRYREELAEGKEIPAAIERTLNTAGRTVIFSAVTVALSLMAMAIFPMYFLRSFAYAGLAVVPLVAAASLIIAPAMFVLLGHRINSFDVRKFIRKVLGRPEPIVKQPHDTWWYKITKKVLRFAVPVGLTIVVFLLFLGSPVREMNWGMPDDRVMSKSSPGHKLGDDLRKNFKQNAAGTITIVVDKTADNAIPELDRYVKRLSVTRYVDAVISPRGIVVGGQRVLDGDPTSRKEGVEYYQVITAIAPFTSEGKDLLDFLRAVDKPSGTKVYFNGQAQQKQDNVGSLIRHLPIVLLVIAVTTFILLFLLTGSLLLPIKALAMNLLSLSATFGAMVWIFQQGHLDALGTTVTGSLVFNMPVLMFCVAFGLSMDYEVFLLSRIREEWLKSGQTREDNDEAVALGIAQTGRIVTAAAVLMGIVFAAIAGSGISFMRMFGLGLAIAVLMDATLIRMLLVPSFMRLAGRANWWAPAPLRKLHDKIGLREDG